MPLSIVRQDITKMQVDAIVNTTNSEMVGYSGVDLAVHNAAGPELEKDCRAIAPLGLGEARITCGYKLPAKYVIHTCGPVWQGGLMGENAILHSCYTHSLQLAVEHKCESIAFPLISSGNYGYPKDKVLKFAVGLISEFLLREELNVFICVYDRESYSFSKELFEDIKSFIDDDGIADEYDDFAPKEASRPLPYAKGIMASPPPPCANSPRSQSLFEYLKDMDRGFAEMLFDLIDQRGMSDVECYKKANVDKRTFSKIKSNKGYRPSKQTAIAFAIALELDLDTTQELLSTLGYTLSRASVFDKIIRYFIHNKNYNIFEINEALFEFDQSLLGSL